MALSNKATALAALTDAKSNLDVKHKKQQDDLIATQAEEASSLDAALTWLNGLPDDASPLPQSPTPTVGS